MPESTGFVSAEDGFAVLVGMRGSAGRLADVEFGKLLDDDLFEVGRELETLLRLVWAAQVAWTDEADQRGLAAARSCASTRALLVEMLRIPGREASARVEAARTVHPQDLPSGGDTPAVLPLLGAAVTAGLVDPDHVGVLIGTMTDFPTGLDEGVRSGIEQTLVGHAVDLPADQFRRVAQHLVEVFDVDGAPDDREPVSRAEFSIGTRSAATGLTSISGRLDDVSVEVLRTAIVGCPRPARRPTESGIRGRRRRAGRTPWSRCWAWR